MDFHQPVTTARFRANSLISSLPTNILNEILEIINQEITLKINTYRDQMLTYAQEIDEKLSNCKDSRNKYYQICQQLTTKYSKLKKKYEHLYTRYQSYKGRNKELFALLQYLSSEDIRVQHNILKYQNKYKANQTNNNINNNVNGTINNINNNINNINNVNNIHILPNHVSHLNTMAKMREASDMDNTITSSTSHIPSPSAISSPSSIFHNNTQHKRHSKSKTSTSIPFRNSLLINNVNTVNNNNTNDQKHKLLTNQPSAVSTHATTSNAKNYNPFSGYYGNSYKRNSNSSELTTHTISIHNDTSNEHPSNNHHNNHHTNTNNTSITQPKSKLLLRNNNSHNNSNTSLKLRLVPSNTSPLPNNINAIHPNSSINSMTQSHSNELEGYDDTNMSSHHIKHSHSHRHNNHKYNVNSINVSNTPSSLRPSNFSPETYAQFNSNTNTTHTTISDIDLDLNGNLTHIQPVAMPASLFMKNAHTVNIGLQLPQSEMNINKNKLNKVQTMKNRTSSNNTLSYNIKKSVLRKNNKTSKSSNLLLSNNMSLNVYGNEMDESDEYEMDGNVLFRTQRHLRDINSMIVNASSDDEEHHNTRVQLQNNHTQNNHNHNHSNLNHTHTRIHSSVHDDNDNDSSNDSDSDDESENIIPEQVVIDMVDLDNQQSNTSTLADTRDRNSSNIDYSHCSHSSSLLSDTHTHSSHSSSHSRSRSDAGSHNTQFSDENGETETQTFYYEQLKLTPVPFIKKRVIDKNRLIGILQNLPNTNESPSNIIHESDYDETDPDNDDHDLDEIESRDDIDASNINIIHHENESMNHAGTINQFNGTNNESMQKQHSRDISSQMSFPDIDKITHEKIMKHKLDENNNNHNDDDEKEEVNTVRSQSHSHSHSHKHSKHSKHSSKENKTNELRSHSNGSKHKVNPSYKNDRNNKHIRSSTFGSHDYMCDTPRNKASKMITGKTIKLFYRFGNKSYPPIMAKTTNTIYQLRAMIASTLQNIDANKLLISHRAQVLNNLDLTLSQCDIAQYDTMIAKIDTTRALFSPPPPLPPNNININAADITDNNNNDIEDIISSSSNITSPIVLLHSSRSRPQSAKSNHSFNHFESVTPAPINVHNNHHHNHHHSNIHGNNNSGHSVKGPIHKMGKRLWTPGKTPHSVGSLSTSHPTPRTSACARKRVSGIHNHSSIIQPRKSQLFNSYHSDRHNMHAHTHAMHSTRTHRHNLSDDSYMSYPLSPPVSQASEVPHNGHTHTHTAMNMNDTNMSIVADQIGAMSAMNKINEEETVNVTEKKIDTTNTNNNSHNQSHLRNPLFNISRPVSMRRYNNSREYPFSVCPPSVAAQSPKNISNMNTHNNMNTAKMIIEANNNNMRMHYNSSNSNHNHAHPPPLPMSKQLLAQQNKIKYKISQNNHSKKRSSHVRFANDTKYNQNTSLELRRNLSRSLDVRMDDNMNNHRKHTVKSYDNSNCIDTDTNTASFSPLPSRRRTQKLEKAPLIKLMNTANCKKSKSLSILKMNNPINKTKRRSFTKKGSKLNGMNLMNGIREIEISEMSNSSQSQSSQSPTMPPVFDRKKSTLLDSSHRDRRNSISSNLSVNVMDPDANEEENDIHELNQNCIDNENDNELQLERDVSREDIVSGDDISVEEYPNFNERERRKTIEIGKAPMND